MEQFTGKSPLDIFYGKLNTQIGYAGDLKEGKTVNTRSCWFRKDGNGYVLRIGRNALEIAGSKLFRAQDLDGVIQLLNAAKVAIETDKALQDTIATNSMERRETSQDGTDGGKGQAEVTDESACAIGLSPLATAGFPTRGITICTSPIYNGVGIFSEQRAAMSAFAVSSSQANRAGRKH